MRPQACRDYHVYEYDIPLEDWEIPPPRDERHAYQMQYMPHSNRVYVTWKRLVQNPIRHVGEPIRSEYGGHYQPTHWATEETAYMVTFYARDIPEDKLPRPYTWVAVGLEYRTAGGPTMDDPLGQFDPQYEVIRLTRTAYA